MILDRDKMKLGIAVLAMVIVVGGVLLYAAESSGLGREDKKWLHTDGRYIRDEQGRRVHLRGISKMGLEYTQEGYHIVENDYDIMKEMGANVVRIPYTMEWIYEEDYLYRIDLQIQWCKERDMYVILDMHRPTHKYQKGFPKNQTYWMQQWMFLAERYRNEDTVVGFDLWNEPRDVSWKKWRDAAQNCAKLIHDVNPKLLIIVEGVGWGWDLLGVQTIPLDEPNVVYSPHIYPYPLSRLDWSYLYKNGEYEAGYLQLREYIRTNWEPILDREIAPVMTGEFGTPVYEEHNLVWFEDLLDIMHELEMSYICWVLYGSDKPRDCALLKPDWETLQPQAVILLRYLAEPKIEEKANKD